MVPTECYLVSHSSLLQLFIWPFMVDEWHLFVIESNNFSYRSTTAIAMRPPAQNVMYSYVTHMLMGRLFLVLVCCQADSGRKCLRMCAFQHDALVKILGCAGSKLPQAWQAEWLTRTPRRCVAAGIAIVSRRSLMHTGIARLYASTPHIPANQRN